MSKIGQILFDNVTIKSIKPESFPKISKIVKLEIKNCKIVQVGTDSFKSSEIKEFVMENNE